MPELRPMYLGDLHRVLSIINDYDEDDCEAAEVDYQRDGLDGQFVLEQNDEIIGVTGYRLVPATDKTVWLSWTYICREESGKGHGKSMLDQLLNKLNTENVRKVFIKVSNYEDPDDGKIYERAHKMYRSAGFELELTNNDFYDQGEDQLIYSKALSYQTNDDTLGEVTEERPVIRFNGLYEIAESDGAYTFSWVVEEKKKLFGKRSFSVEDLKTGLVAVKSDGGRKVFLTFPSNLPLIHQPLQAAGFKFVGELKDYYENGVNEMHFSHTLDNIG